MQNDFVSRDQQFTIYIQWLPSRVPIHTIHRQQIENIGYLIEMPIGDSITTKIRA